jgi:Major Facilitator Superfamily
MRQILHHVGCYVNQIIPGRSVKSCCAITASLIPITSVSRIKLLDTIGHVRVQATSGDHFQAWAVYDPGGRIAMCAAFGSTPWRHLYFYPIAGASAIPLYYILFSAISIPTSIGFSLVIDRWSRKTTMTLLLVIHMASSAGISLFIDGSVYTYYVMYLVISVCELMMYSIYYIMFYDYFTVVEGKRYGGAMTIALGVGAVIGALLISLLTEFAEARRVFLALPVLIGLTLAHLTWLTRRKRPLDETQSGAEEGIFESLKALPMVSRRYPIVLLLAASMFINVVGQMPHGIRGVLHLRRDVPGRGESCVIFGQDDGGSRHRRYIDRVFCIQSADPAPGRGQVESGSSGHEFGVIPDSGGVVQSPGRYSGPPELLFFGA